jgi:hypothetical protein
MYVHARLTLCRRENLRRRCPLPKNAFSTYERDPISLRIFSDFALADSKLPTM